MRSTINTIKISQLFTYKVKNYQGEKLGKITDLVIDFTTGQCVYAVLIYSNFAGIEEKYFAVPVTSLHPDHTNECILLDVSKDYFENVSGFNKDNWPDMADLQLGKQSN